MTNVPWGLGLATDRLPVSPPPYAHVELDPLTQLARYTDAAGQVIEMSKHGTNKTKGTVSKSGGSGGSDGQAPKPQVEDDVTTDYEAD
ncbi:putative ATP-grasp-modified RiPP [Streptomyces sp. NPDC020965]|uniref:putative ATP-grasp-modified RiPP n=1 Tax=Streptomyces sp. NPDC020965 TaxID=3365105 RepID=UPI0037A3C167